MLAQLAERLTNNRGIRNTVISSADFVTKGLAGARKPSLDLAFDALARRPDLPQDAMRQLHEHGDVNARRGLAENPAVPLPLLERLLGDEDDVTRQAAARHPSTPWAKHDTLPSDHTTLIGLAQHPNAHLDLRLQAMTGLNLSSTQTLARSRHTPPELLERLHQFPGTMIRTAALANPNTSPGALAHTAETEESAGPLKTIARHPNTPEGTLAALAHH